ncbi:hypothetical protein QQF64_006651 [Cirrhinus molitorella]|uniref:Transposase Tc1-like domain-containing protein n=1 Tax=Cirrhinus molitorella TaxID=172907 RepID=A0ABR3MAV0_9TELE
MRTAPRKGRPRVTSAAEDKFIRVTSLRNRKLTAPQIRAQIIATQSSCSRHISTSTVQRRLRKSGLYDRSGQSILFSNVTHMTRDNMNSVPAVTVDVDIPHRKLALASTIG